MARFRVHLHGHNLVVNLDGVRRLVGFRGARVVEAETVADAKERALALIRTHPAVTAPLNGPGDPLPLVLPAKVEPLPSWPVLPTKQPGLTFFVQPAEILPVS
jgi:hypothetical protein